MAHEEHAGNDEHDVMHFSANKVFAGLFLFTMCEVGWGLLGKHAEFNRLMLWGGLLFFAFLKGWLIAVYFMHLRFEGWVVKSLILPTPFLVMVIFGYVMPDVANKEGRLIHPIGSAVDPKTGNVVEDMEVLHPGEADTAHGGEHAEAGEKH